MFEKPISIQKKNCNETRDVLLEKMLSEFCFHILIYLKLNDINRRRTKPNSPQTNGFVERLNQTTKSF